VRGWNHASIRIRELARSPALDLDFIHVLPGGRARVDMPKTVVPASDSESAEEPRSARKSTSMKMSSKRPEPVESDNEPDVEGFDEEEEEYEIEKILEGKLGVFGSGRMGYLVKWKGYDDSHNSWVDENDAGNAEGLIKEYWDKLKKDKKGPRKSAGTAPKSSASKARKSSTIRDESSEVEEVRPKKRGRPPKGSKAVSDEPEMERNDDDEKSAREKKKPRRSAPSNPEPMDEDGSSEETFRSMKTWMSSATWEHIVDTIDTVERTVDGRLLVYFTLKHNKGRAREETKICKEKMPRKLLDFYEGNLRWRTSEETMEE